MKWPWVAGVFLLGAGSGWVLKPEAKPFRPLVGGIDHEGMQTKAKRTPAQDSKWKGFGEKFLKLSEEERSKIQRELNPADRGPFLMSLIQNAGMDGLDYQLKAVVQDVLRSWAREDFDGAWAWAQGLESTALRHSFAASLLESLSSTDLMRAFELECTMREGDGNFPSTVAQSMLKDRAKVNAEEYVKILQRIPNGGTNNATDYQFAGNFDYAQAAEAIVALKKARDGQAPPQMPTNFFESWAAKDPEAVHAWWIKNGAMSFADSWGDIYSTLERTQGIQSAADWAFEKLNAATPEQRQTMLGECKIWPGELNASLIDAVAQRQPNTAASDELYASLLTITNSHLLTGQSKDSFLLARISTPEARLAAIRDATQRGVTFGNQFSETLLTQWQLTAPQVKQAIQEGTKMHREANAGKEGH